MHCLALHIKISSGGSRIFQKLRRRAWDGMGVYFGTEDIVVTQTETVKYLMICYHKDQNKRLFIYITRITRQQRIVNNWSLYDVIVLQTDVILGTKEKHYPYELVCFDPYNKQIIKYLTIYRPFYCVCYYKVSVTFQDPHNLVLVFEKKTTRK